MSSSKRGRSRTAMNRADLERSLEASGMLTAYTVGATSAATATSDADKSFLTKRNKNQKKREAAQKQQIAAAAETDETAKRQSESDNKGRPHAAFWKSITFKGDIIFKLGPNSSSGYV